MISTSDLGKVREREKERERGRERERERGREKEREKERVSQTERQTKKRDREGQGNRDRERQRERGRNRRREVDQITKLLDKNKLIDKFHSVFYLEFYPTMTVNTRSQQYSFIVLSSSNTYNRRAKNCKFYMESGHKYFKPKNMKYR